MGRGPETPAWKRHCAIAYAFDLSMPQVEIARRLNLTRSTVHNLVRAARARSPTSDLADLQAAVSVQPRSGRPRRADPGDEVSLTVRRGVREHPYQAMDNAANRYLRERQVLGEIDQNIRPLGVQQVYNILQDSEQCAADPEDQRVYTRHRVYRRNELSAANIAKRQAYLFEVEQLEQAEAIIICCDEKAYHFGGTPDRHVTLPINTSSYQSCAPTRFKLEQWAAACGDDCSVKRPWTVWELRDQTSEELQKQLDECNAQARRITDEQRANARVHGTPEHQYLVWMNTQVKIKRLWMRANANDSGGPKEWTVERLFPYQSHDIKEGTKKLNFVWYAFEVYRKLLFPYYREICRRNPGRRVVIQEDNHGPHLKARQLLQPEIQQQGIVFVNHPGNSPDLAPIEGLQGEHERKLAGFIYEVRDAQASTVRRAKDLLRITWQSKDFDETVRGKVCRAVYVELAKRCKMAGGGNHFRDDVYIHVDA